MIGTHPPPARMLSLTNAVMRLVDGVGSSLRIHGWVEGRDASGDWERHAGSGIATVFLLVCIGVLLAPAPAFATSPEESLPYARTPEGMLAEIGNRGAADVSVELYNSASWLPAMRHVESGNQDWLLAALGLSSGTDGAAATELTLSISRALLTNPEGVLELFLSTTPPRLDPCHGWGEFAGHRTFESAFTDVQAKIARLEQVSDPGLAPLRDACIQRLREAEPLLRKIYSRASK